MNDADQKLPSNFSTIIIPSAQKVVLNPSPLHEYIPDNSQNLAHDALTCQENNPTFEKILDPLALSPPPQSNFAKQQTKLMVIAGAHESACAVQPIGTADDRGIPTAANSGIGAYAGQPLMQSADWPNAEVNIARPVTLANSKTLASQDMTEERDAIRSATSATGASAQPQELNTFKLNFDKTISDFDEIKI